MKTAVRCLLLCVLFIPAPPLDAENHPAPDARLLEKKTAEWVALRREIAAERRRGKEARAFLEQTLDLLGRERDRLREEIEAWEREKGTRTRERLDLLEKREAYTLALETLEPHLRRAHESLLRWRARLPGLLAEGLDPAFDRLETGGARAGAAQRLQWLLQVYARLEEIQHQVHTGREILEPPGGTRECQVLYLGLAAGYAVTLDGSTAGMGRPGPEGWTWTWNRTWVAPVRAALAQAGREQAAEIVALPLQVDADGR